MAPGARAACDALLFWFASVTYCFSGEGVSASGFFFLLNTPAEAEIVSSSRIKMRAFIAPSQASRLPQPSRSRVLYHRHVREIVFRCANSAVGLHRPVFRKPPPEHPIPVVPRRPLPSLPPYLLFPPEMPRPNPSATLAIQRVQPAEVSGRSLLPGFAQCRSVE